MAKKEKPRGRHEEAEYVQEIIDGTLGLDEAAVARRLHSIYRWMKVFMAPTLVGRENIPRRLR